MSNILRLMIESLVAILLLLTIVYCVRLNEQLKRLKADEQSLKATIAELITATEIAERAIAGLKVTVREGDADAGRAPAGAPSASRSRCERNADGRRRGARPARADRRRTADGRRAEDEPREAGADAEDHRRGGAGLCRARARARERPRGMIRLAARFPADPGRAGRDVACSRSRPSGLFFDGGYTLGQRLGGGNTLVVTTRADERRSPEVRSPAVRWQVAADRGRRSAPGCRRCSTIRTAHGDVTGSVADDQARRRRRGEAEADQPSRRAEPPKPARGRHRRSR